METTSTNAVKIDMAKNVVIDLKKEKDIENENADTVLCLDFSQSMYTLYHSGFVQQVMNRNIPIALGFDPKGSMPVYIFNDDAWRILPDVTLENLDDYVKNNILSKYNFGGTMYAPAIKMITNNFVKANNAEPEQSIAGKIGSWFSGKKPEAKQVTVERPTFVLFLTDGENFDKTDSQAAIVDAAKHAIFWQFIGLQSSSSDTFSFLTKLDKLSGRFIDNANFIQLSDKQMVEDPKHKTVYLDDKALYSLLLNEFPGYIKEARTKKLIK